MRKLAGLVFVTAGCIALPSVHAQSAAVRPTAEFKVPAESTIPSGPQGDAIRNGKLLLTETHQRLPNNVGNKLTCANCHIGAGTTPNASPWVGIWGVFPEYRSRGGQINSLQQRVNDCFQRSMNGKALPYDSKEMNDILAYMQWLSTGVPTGVSVKGRGFGPINRELKPNADNGKAVYAAKCASCHGVNGEGMKDAKGAYTFPALWGKDSFNVGAGMARTYTAAAFVKHNMPLGQPNTLTDQEAVDVAEFFTHQPRPDYAPKVKDWPKGDKPKDARS
ncbi:MULTISPECIES: c-type cytochrome [Noviherbaspirillum]|jgi:thiosulfate dehydrogenase|uniref:C-type cytochrome n=1 Tax=Noviherbaspirillum album TaxID=3080276 RepID=A0ABU6J4B1_9BURK|nr:MULTISPECIES: c-type cytochrome [Noviherbaspirillum]MEC4718363.1 c-type cytochrome [Noviherbaspirillum sp. CPCC 100848]